MQTFTSTDLNRTSGAILQAAEQHGTVEIRKGTKVFQLSYVRTDDTYVTEPSVRTEEDPWKDEMLSLMRELVQQGREVPGGLTEKTQPAEVVDSGVVTVRIDEEPQERPVVVIPEEVPAKEPEVSPEPSQGELEAAYEYLGLVATPDGYTITERGLQSASATVRKTAKENPESAEAKVMQMGSADEERVEFLLLVQIDKLSKALAKRAAGDPRWLGAATP
ncbi:hypothetical protein [Streptomyces sp. NPDC001089]